MCRFAVEISETDLTMNRNYTKILFSTLFSSVLMTGCVNEEYDLEKIDVGDVNILENVSLPVGSTKEFVLSEILDKAGYAEYLSVAQDGSYYFHATDGRISKQVTVPVFQFSGYDDENPHMTKAAEGIIMGSVDPDFTTPPIPFENVVFDIEIDQADIPEIVRDVKYADVTTSVIVRFKYEIADLPFEKIWLSEGLTIVFPEWIVLGNPPAGCQKVDSHAIVLSEDYSIEPDNTGMSFDITALDFSKMPENQGIVAPGKLHIDAEVILSGSLFLRAADCPQSLTGIFTPVFTSYLHMDPMTINYVLADLDLESETSNEYRFSLKDFTEFADGEQFKPDVNAFSLKIDVASTIPAPVFISSVFATYDEGTSEPESISEVQKMEIPGESQDKAATASYNFTQDQLGSLFSPLPDYLVITSMADLVAPENGLRLVPGDEFGLDMTYSLDMSPFGPAFRINYETELTGLDVSVSDLSLAKAVIKLNALNTIPLNINLTAVATDVDGNALSNIKAEVNTDIRGGTMESPAVTPVVITLTSEGHLEFDGIRLAMAAVPASGTVSLKKEQYIQFTDISLNLPEGVGITIE